jgi:hypothetical protein
VSGGTFVEMAKRLGVEDPGWTLAVGERRPDDKEARLDLSFLERGR